MTGFRELSLNIVAVQATIDQRHYAALYRGDDQQGDPFFRLYLNGKAVGSIIWDRSLKKFKSLRFTLHARAAGMEDNYVFPNEVQKKLTRKLLQGFLFRMVKIRLKRKIGP